MKLLTIVLLCTSFAWSQTKELTVIHWNDFHSQNLPFQVKTKSRLTNTDTTFFVGGSATLSAYINNIKRSSKNSILLNAGDDFQGSPISAITKGKSQIELMTLLNPDAMELGNHEFDYGRTQLSEYVGAASFPILSANIVDAQSKKTFSAPYTIKTVDGIKIGIIGLMTEELPTLSLPDNVKHLEIKPLAETVNNIIPELKKQNVDIIIALTHVGVQDDSLLALHAPDLDLIVGGHSHTPLFRPKKVNGITIVQAGSRGRWVGKVELTVDTEKDTILKAFGELIECRTADVVPDPVVAKKVDALENLAAKELDEEIGTLQSDWVRSGRSESNIGNWISDAIRAYAKTDVAFQNSGGIRKELLAGKIVVRDLWEISPFANMLVTFSVSGETLRNMIQHQLNLNDDFCQVSGLKIVYRTVNGKRLLHNVKVNNQLVDEKKMYSIATNNYVAAQSKKYFGIELTPAQITQLNSSDRDMLIDAVREQKKINSVIEGRIKEAEE